MKTPSRWLLGLALALMLGVGPAGPPGFAVAHDHDHDSGHDHAGGLPDDHADCALCLAVHHLAVEVPAATAAPVRVESPCAGMATPPGLPSRSDVRAHRNRGPPICS